MSEHMERQFTSLTVRIERERCIGSGNCVKVAPEIFELDEGGIVMFRRDAGEIEPTRLTEACDVCPVDALIVHDRSGKRIVPPT